MSGGCHVHADNCGGRWQLPRRSKVDEYAVEGVDYTDWSSDEEDDEAATGAEQVDWLSS